MSDTKITTAPDENENPTTETGDTLNGASGSVESAHSHEGEVPEQDKPENQTNDQESEK